MVNFWGSFEYYFYMQFGVMSQECQRTECKISHDNQWQSAEVNNRRAVAAQTVQCRCKL